MKKLRDIVEEYYYHGTSKENADHIIKHGLNTNNSKYDGKIYLTKNHGEAQKYGKIKSGGKTPVVLKVHKDHLSKDHIHSDYSGVVEYKGNLKPEHISTV